MNFESMVYVTFQYHAICIQSRKKNLYIYGLWIGPTYFPVLYKVPLFFYYFIITLLHITLSSGLWGEGILSTFLHVNKLKLTVVK